MKSFSELTSASQVNNEDLLSISQTSGSGYASKKTTVKDITDKSNLNLAEEYDSTSTYAVDDYVIYESVLYKCIGTTTGTFDSTKWTSVVVTDEMGSGGGGGTGGHTIIDENGNSMTARAGLQFVGGANVSDDATNNKTIVDLASAGGIDGVFIDTDNVIQASTPITSSADVSYTATEDCAVLFAIASDSNNSANIKINNIIIWEQFDSNGINQFSNCLFVKKGQTIKFHHTFTGSTGSYTVYGIQTGTTHSKFQPVIYSTEEREIGVWTDGKPLYQKTITLSSGVSVADSWTTIYTDALIGSIGQLVKVLYDNMDNHGTYGVMNYKPNGNNLQAVYPISGGLNILSGAKFTLYYTKTADTAGSGTWTPQGVPAVHYSTEEQVIGTWIDGNTLYQKTIDCGALPNNTTKTVDYDISNVQKFVGFEGVGVSGNGGLIPIPFVNDTTKDEDLLCIVSVPNANIRFTSKGNKSAYNGYVTLRYIKSTS